jgi:hypothetical protein
MKIYAVDQQVFESSNVSHSSLAVRGFLRSPVRGTEHHTPAPRLRTTPPPERPAYLTYLGQLIDLAGSEVSRCQ